MRYILKILLFWFLFGKIRKAEKNGDDKCLLPVSCEWAEETGANSDKPIRNFHCKNLYPQNFNFDSILGDSKQNCRFQKNSTEIEIYFIYFMPPNDYSKPNILNASFQFYNLIE